MSYNFSLRKLAAVLAVEKGFRVIDGVLFKGKKPSTAKLIYINKYPNIDVKLPRSRKHTLTSVHYITAYQKYGVDFVSENLELRHLDGNLNNFSEENIELGTKSQNMLDKSAESRIKTAIKASTTRRVLSDEMVIEFRADRDSGLSFSELAKKYNLSGKGQAHHIYNHSYVTKK